MGVRLIRLVGIIVVAVSLWWGLAWAAARALVVKVALPRADVLLVLSGAPTYRERFLYAARLFVEGRASKILLTNDGVKGSWSRTLQKNPLLSERATLQMTWAGVPPDRIEVLPGRVSSTHDEAQLMRQYAQAHAIRSILVVTSGFHTRRALWTLRQVFRGTEIKVGVEAAIPESMTSPGTWWWHVRGWQMVPVEYVKLAYYRLRYR
jgi:uncharacterized SAM-binding protein YcdF (DUF218 family)